MKTSTETPEFSDIWRAWSRHWGWALLGTLLTTALFAAAATILPQRFKSRFVLAIHSSYFQNPLTRDLTPDIYDAAEMRSQRESLIRQSMTPDFIDYLGRKYGIYQA